ncbi:MAG: heavy-metal-associated domain-containing protein [Conexivisphaerales archaeon]
MTHGKRSRAAFLVREISCATCAMAIEKQTKKLDGVSDVRVAVMLNKVFVDYDPSKVRVEEIREAVDRTGYGAYVAFLQR